MDNNESQHHDSRLRKEEILSGYNSYSKVLKSSILISTEYLKAFVNSENIEPVSIDLTKSPLFTDNVKVGFIIAKKKIKKSVLRNRIKRLLRESYRLNKYLINPLPLKLILIFSLTEKGYNFFLNNPETKFEFSNTEMKILLEKIKKNLAMSFAAIFFIKFYQRLISPLLSGSCRHYPSCSHYGIEAFTVHGFFVGFYLTVKRILKCNPFFECGYDPVPPGKNNSNSLKSLNKSL